MEEIFFHPCNPLVCVRGWQKVARRGGKMVRKIAKEEKGSWRRAERELIGSEREDIKLREKIDRREMEVRRSRV